MPSSVATIPQAIVSVGSHSRGVVRLSMMLQGIWGPLESARLGPSSFACLEKHIADKVHG